MFAADSPLNQKLMQGMLLVGATVLMLLVAAFGTYQFVSYRSAMVEQLTALGGVVASNSTAALAFDDQRDATEILSALQAEPQIVAAALFDADGELFARYPANLPDDQLPSSLPQTRGLEFTAKTLAGFLPVQQADDKPLGTLYLRSSMDAFYRAVYLLAFWIAIVAVASLTVAYLLTRRLQQQISQPLQELAGTATAISERGDFSVRAPPVRQPEIALLTQAFNQMLHTIEKQNQQLSDSAQRLRAVLDSALSAVIVIDSRGMITEWNACAERTFGWQKEEAIGQDLGRLVMLPKDRDAHRRGMERFLATSEIRVIGRLLEMTAVRRDGTEFPIELSITVLRTEDQLSFCGFLTDVTEKKLAQSRLQGQLSRLHLLQRITHAIGERQDLPSIFQVVVRSLEQDMPVDLGCVCRYQASPPRLIVMSIGALDGELAQRMGMLPDAEIPVDGNGLSRCIGGELVYEPDVREVKFPFPERIASGGLRALVAAPLRFENQTFGVLLVARRHESSFSSPDCEFLRQLSEHVALAVHQVQLYDRLQRAYDDLRQSQQTVLQQERLRALGQMSSGIAHDINNAISPITLYTETLLDRETGLSERARGYLRTIQRSIDDVANTVARMREFYRPREQHLTLSAVDLNELVLQVIDMTRARWLTVPQERGIVIDVRTQLDRTLSPIAGVESEIRDALTNLMFNAVDAMPQGGTITLRTVLLARGGARMAAIEVQDTGVGMDEDTRRRCLEPFFTTKGERGTGLGLAMVYGMVQRHNGNVEIDSEPGRGTTMRLAFPLSVTQETAAVEDAPAAPVSRLNLLIIDDDPLLLESLQDILIAEGHTVTCADGGAAGIEIFSTAVAEGRSFSLVMTDLGMPHVDGRAVAERVKALSPDTPVLLLTGWGQRLVATQSVPPFVDRVLAKPPKLKDLRAVLAALTQSHAPHAH
jgi:PAS domain S-box-containing protein